MQNQEEIAALYNILKDVTARLRVLEQSETPSEASIPPAPVAQGDMIKADSTPEWGVLTIGAAHYLIKTNSGGTDFAWDAFDWDAIAAALGADMVHSHGSNTEGGPVDWNVIKNAPGADLAHTHLNSGQGGTLTLASLTNHTKANHDSLNIDADTIDALNSTQFIRSDVVDIVTGRITVSGAASGEAYNASSLEIAQAWSLGVGIGPRITFHYAGAQASQIGFFTGDNSGDISSINLNGNGYAGLRTDMLRLMDGLVIAGEIHADASWLRLNQSSTKGVYTKNQLLTDGGLVSGGGGSVVVTGGDIAATNDIELWNGATQMGQLSFDDATWFRINQNVAKSIYTPRMLRSDGGIASGNISASAGQVIATNAITTTTGYITSSKTRSGRWYPLSNTTVINQRITFDGLIIEDNFYRSDVNRRIHSSESGQFTCTLHVLIYFSTTGRVDVAIRRDGAQVSRVLAYGNAGQFSVEEMNISLSMTANTTYIEGILLTGVTGFVQGGTTYWTYMSITKAN